MFPPRSVLTRYDAALDGLRWQRVPGGFSGATVWRGDDETGRACFALKRWPPGFATTRLAAIHNWMSRAVSLPFVPRLLPTADGNTVLSEHGTVWDATDWMLGAPFEAPNQVEVEVACMAIAQLHAIWHNDSPPMPCRGVTNRLRVLRDWLAAPIAPVVSHSFAPNVNSLLRQLVESVNRLGPAAATALEVWENRPVAVKPCVRDLRGEHVLFTNARVTGIVDYGAMAEDCPAVDLARFLGDVAGNNESRFTAGLRAYRDSGGELDVPDDFVRQLDWGGALGSAIIWINRLSRERRAYPDVTSVENRLALLLLRLQHFAPV